MRNVSAILIDDDVFRMHLSKRKNVGTIGDKFVLYGYKWSEIKRNKGVIEYLISNICLMTYGQMISRKK